MRTFVSENGSEYTRTEVVKSQPVIDAYVRLMGHGTVVEHVHFNRPPSFILCHSVYLLLEPGFEYLNGTSFVALLVSGFWVSQYSTETRF